MNLPTGPFDSLARQLASDGPDAVLRTLDEAFRAEGKHHERFEVLKMRARRELDLPLLATDRLEDLDEGVRTLLEERLLLACRSVGTDLMEAGKLREGWMYLRPVGDRKVASAFLRGAKLDESNLDEVIEIALGEGVDPEFGYGLVLEEFGTCNSITAFETQVRPLPKSDQQACAALLVKHLHTELLRNVRDDIERRTGAAAVGERLNDLVADRDWLFGEMSYHVDTTHLASAVRFARVLEAAEPIRLALDLTEYGRRLNERFQYQGDAPFEQLHTASRLFFRTLLGEGIDEGLAYFRDKAIACDVYHQGSAAVEVYVDLLARTGRLDEAIAMTLDKLPPGTRTQGIAPTLYELCRRKGDFEPMLRFCRDKQDLLGFATALLSQG